MKTTMLVFLTLVVVSFTGSAQPTAWKSDKAHSRVDFSVSHMVIAEVTGRFKDFEVKLQQPREDLTDAVIEATIKTNSIDTDNEFRDKHLRSDDFLNAEKYPELKFKSTSIEKTGKDTYTIHGDLTIRDSTKNVALETKYKGEITDDRGTVKRAFKATTTIDRFEFGTKWNKVIEAGGLVAGREVSITLLMEFNKEK